MLVEYPRVLYKEIQELCKQITYLALTNNFPVITAINTINNCKINLRDLCKNFPKQ